MGVVVSTSARKPSGSGFDSPNLIKRLWPVTTHHEVKVVSVKIDSYLFIFFDRFSGVDGLRESMKAFVWPYLPVSLAEQKI